MGMTDILHPRVDGDTCIRCRRKFLAGDRVNTAMIVMKTGRHPNNPNEVGVHLSSEFELAHVDCNDRGLTVPVLTFSP